MYNKKKIICVTGADGSGKSTLISHLKKQLPNACEVSVWDMLEHPEAKIFGSKKEVDDYLCLLSPDARLLFLAHAMQAAIDQAMQSDAEILLINAYYYKYFAAEKTMGADTQLEYYLASRMPVPHKTIFLSLSPEESAARKQRLSKYECGCREATTEHFIDFQKRAIVALEEYIKPDWCVINAMQDRETLCALALQFISE